MATAADAGEGVGLEVADRLDVGAEAVGELGQRRARAAVHSEAAAKDDALPAGQGAGLPCICEDTVRLRLKG